MKQYKAIFIDWDDTIGDFHNAAYRSLQYMYEHFGIAECYDSFEQFYDIYEQHNLWLWEQYGQDKVTKEYLEHDRMFYPLMMAPRPLPVTDCLRLALQMGKTHLEMTTEFFALIPGADEMVRYLSSKYPLTVVSNGFVEVQYRKIERSGLGNCFRHVVLSEEVGAQKPNPVIFEKALALSGLKAEEVLMIGDSWTSDIQGAIAAGIDQMWIQWPSRRHDPNLPATYKVTSLAQLMAEL